ncbi:hypothetical protein IDH44_05730, partial [Paenibacillus sp. IB182496]
AGAAAQPRPAPERRAAAAGVRPEASKRQRLYVKIAAAREQGELLERLQELLARHAGQLETVLFYARTQRTLALSDKYNVKPSPRLIGEIEALLGEGSAVVR